MAAVTVGIVDDHEALREGLATVLRAHGLDVLGSAGSVAAGRDLVAVAAPDVVVLDVGLPDGSGIELCRELIDRRAGQGVVLYTAEADVRVADEGLQAGARGFALKAVATDELVAAIRSVAAGGTFVDPRISQALLERRTSGPARRLSPREREATRLVAEGLTAADAAAAMGVSEETVRTHIRGTIRKLEARNRVHAVVLALEAGEITREPR
jgi:DNA-binding NarL/FixJ family response regulator